MTQSWDTAELAARETAVRTGSEVVAISVCTFMPHGLPQAALPGVLAATPSELVFVADRSPQEAVRHALDPARQPTITASRVLPGSLDFGDGRLFVLPSKQARAIKAALQRTIETN